MATECAHAIDKRAHHAVHIALPLVFLPKPSRGSGTLCRTPCSTLAAAVLRRDLWAGHRAPRFLGAAVESFENTSSLPVEFSLGHLLRDST